MTRENGWSESFPEASQKGRTFLCDDTEQWENYYRIAFRSGEDIKNESLVSENDNHNSILITKSSLMHRLW